MAPVHHDGYRIAFMEPDDRPGFLDLHHRVFGGWPEPAADAIFDWKYVENPFVDETPVVVARHDGEVVGANGFFAVELSVGDTTVLGLQSGDLMVHPDHRRNGLFSRMTDVATARYGTDGVLLFTFPAAAPRRGYLDRGWRRVNNPEFVRFRGVDRGPVGWPPDASAVATRLLQRVYDAWTGALRTMQSPSTAYDVERLESVPADTLHRLYRRHVPDGIHVRRTASLYDWRLSNPQYDTTTYVARRDGSAQAAVVVDERRNRLLLRELLPFAGVDDALLAALERVVADSADHGELVAWPPASRARLLYRCGFLPTHVTPYRYRSSDVVVNSPDWTVAGTRVDEADSWQLQLLARDH